MTHHAGHDGERARGASAFLGWPDAIWSLVRDDSARFFSAEGRDVWQAETQLDYEHATRRLGLGQAGSRTVARSTEHSTTVAAIVRETPGHSWNDLKRYVKEALSIGTPAAEAAINAAREGGRVLDGRRH